MGYYPPREKRVSTMPLRPVMDQRQMFHAALRRQSAHVSIDRQDSYIMWWLTYAHSKSNTKAWASERKRILGCIDQVVVHKPQPGQLRWAR